VLKRLNRLSEAGRDYCRAKDFPLRDLSAKPNLIDLSRFYNGGFKANWHGHEPVNNLVNLPVGVQTLAEIPFDVRALIQVRLNSLLHPTQVTNIPVAQVCRRIHFLHAAIEAGMARDGTQLGRYVMHLGNGERKEMPVVVGKDLGDWFERPPELGKTWTIAWTGTNARSRLFNVKIRLFKSTWANPLPNVPVQSIDLVATDNQGYPFVVAITTER